MKLDYRAWDVKNKKILSVRNGVCEKDYDIDAGWVSIEYATEWDEFYLLEQFTTVFDKNGNKIYEGDIIESKYGGSDVVERVSGECCNFSCTGFNVNEYASSEILIIGNKHSIEGYMKYSIIIVAYKAEDKLYKCLDSLIKNPPDEPAQIIIVDNNEEPFHLPNQYIKDIAKEYVNIQVVQSGGNIGYAAGANLGADHALGENLIFMNPDVIVYENWCEGMYKYMNPNVGAIGPISNFVAGMQNSKFHLMPYDDHKKNSEIVAKGLSGRAMATKMLIGFCLMTPKEVFEKAGKFDPDLFLGCDDLDYSLKIKKLGLELIIASDVYVYHFGHESFKCNPDSERIGKETENLYIEKLQKEYGVDIPTAIELWGFDMINTQEIKMPKLSVCMIVRDEDKNLEELLPQLDFADEIVIVDTDPVRSSIRNKSLSTVIKGWVNGFAPEIGCKVKGDHFPWVNDFAKARNYALSKCTGDWILWLDADDRIPKESGPLIRAIIDKPGPLTAKKKCHFGLRLRDEGVDSTFFCNQRMI